MPPDHPLPTDKVTADTTPTFSSNQPRLGRHRHSTFSWRRILPFAIVFGVLSLIALVLTVAAVVLMTRTTDVTVISNGEAQQVSTRAHTVQGLLDSLQMVITEDDLLSPPPNTVIQEGLVVQIQRTRTVTVDVDGVAQVHRTTATNPQAILNEMDVAPNRNDVLLVDGTRTDPDSLALWPVPVTHISIRHAITVHIEDDGEPSTLSTTSDTVGAALFEAGITLYLADSVTPDLNTTLQPDMAIVIQRSLPISVVVDGVTIETRTNGTTVADALTDAGVALNGLDYAVPDGDTALRPGMFVRVIRVRETIEIEQELLPFETLLQADANLELDQRGIAQEGQNGVRQTYIRVRYENGAEVSRVPEETITVREPAHRIVTYGTNVVIRTLETPAGPVQYWRRIRMYATSYHPAALGGDNITAVGEILRKGIVGAPPRILPYYTEIYVPGYGRGMIADTGIGPSFTRLWIDLGYEDDDFQIWAGHVDVYVLTPVPDEILYILPES